MADKKTPKYKNSDNATQFAKSYEVNKLPSLTVPNQAISPTEMIARHNKGLPISGKKVTFYDDDGDETITMPDLDKLDLSEIHEMMEANRKYIREQEDKLEAMKLAANEQAAYERFRQKHEKELAKIKDELPVKTDIQPPAGSGSNTK